jgi:hypothetical protein
MFPKGSKEYQVLKKLNTPEKIQTFLETIPFNHEKYGETCMSPLRVLREHKAHCIEGAFLACVCLMLSEKKPLIVSLKVEKPDVDHIIVIFKQNGHYGALSKTNHSVLRYRDPVYRTVRELVMTYFHEYFLYTTGKKTLLGYTKPINMRRFGTKWITSEEDLWDIAETIYDTPIVSVVPKKNQRHLRNAQPFERTTIAVPEWVRE